ncbi:MAG: hypothetical protein N2C12_00645, partial [Planctomycetales bacterium]
MSDVAGGDFPDGKQFAFTIVDDTDNGTVQNLAPVYELLTELGFRSTKTVWPLDGIAGGGHSLEDLAYREFIVELSRLGFEIALHGVQNGDAPRERIELGLDRFSQWIGSYPRIHCNHDHNRDNLYWDTSRIRSRMLRLIVHLATKGKLRGRLEGHREGSEFF